MNNNIISVDVKIDEPNKLIEFAKTLKTVIIQKQMFTNIKGKNYAHVEAWQFCGGALGVLPIIKELTDLSNESMFKYRASVELQRLDTGDVVGYGIAICTNKEKGKENFDEYAIASMAQTRAIGKAYRNGFGWLLKLAGYETTPAEEMSETFGASDEKKTDIVDKFRGAMPQ